MSLQQSQVLLSEKIETETNIFLSKTKNKRDNGKYDKIT